MEDLKTPTYCGYVDIRDDYQIKGWVIDRHSPSKRCSILVLTSKKRVIKITAIHHRADVGRVFGTTGMCGFFFCLKRGVFFSEKIVSVLFLDGTSIEPEAATPPRWFRPSKIQYFMHIQKTAGTSVRHSIEKSVGAENIVYVYPDFPGIPESDFNNLSYEQIKQFKLIFGHFCYGVHSIFPSPFEYYTVIRSPSSRLRSQIYQIMLWTKLSAKSILEIQLSENRFIELDNYYVRSFSGLNPSDSIFDKQDPLVRAQQNTLKNFKSICVLERDDLTTWLAKNFGVSDYQVPRDNVSTYNDDPLNHTHLFNQLMLRNHLDQILYNFLLK